MIIDFHLHERTYSGDAHMNLREIVKAAQQVGLDGICITDHDRMGLTAYAAEIQAAENFPIFVGIEYLALEGDIVCLGLAEDDLPPLYGHARDLIDYVDERGGITIAAHPYRNNSRGLGDLILDLPKLTGVEVLNGSTPMTENYRAYVTCQKAGCKAFGSSDAHRVQQVGRYATEVPGFYRTLPELVQAIREKETKALYLHGYKALDFDDFSRPLLNCT